MNRDRWTFLLRLWGSVAVVVSVLPLLFAPAVFYPGIAAGVVLGGVVTVAAVALDDPDRLRARWETWREANRRTGLLAVGFLAGCGYVLFAGSVMPLTEGESVVSSDHAGLGAAFRLLLFTLFYAFLLWVFDVYGDRVAVNEAPDPP